MHIQFRDTYRHLISINTTKQFNTLIRTRDVRHQHQILLHKVSSHAYTLLLPKEFKIHNTFNMNLLKPSVPPANFSADVSPLTFLLQNLAEPPVESIVDRRGYSLSRQYLVKWKNQHEAHNTWVTPDKLKRV